MREFCPECREEIDYKIKNIEEERKIKGDLIKYDKKVAYCNKCNNEILIPKLRDENLINLEKNYRIENNIIKINEIEEILEKYDIGKRPLSQLLEWGELTLTRYLNGDVPSKQYSNTLNLIKDNPEIYKKYLEEGKNNITETAYKKSLKSLNKFIKNKKDIIVNKENKIENVIRYIIYKSEEITPLALQKLLYFSQSFYMVFNNDLLFEDDCEAWVHGPVYSDIYHKYKNHGYNPIEENLSDYEVNNLLEDEKALIDIVISNFGCYSGKILENMTHIEEPWRKMRKGLAPEEKSRKVINKKVIKQYFEKVKDKYEMIDIADIQDYSLDLFKKVSN